MYKNLILPCTRVMICLVVLGFVLGGCGGSGGTSNTGGSSALSPVADSTFQTTVAPSDADQIIDAGNGVTVLIPGGLLETEQVLKVSKIAGPPAPSEAYKTIRSAYLVELGDLHELGKEVVVGIPYTREGSEDPETSYFGAYYDETIGDWVDLSTSVYAEGNKLFIHTTHLTPIGYGADPGEGSGWKTLKNDQFILFYKLKEAQDQSVGWKPDNNFTQVAGVPTYISDVWNYLIASYNYYREEPVAFKDLRYGERQETGPDGTPLGAEWIRTKVYVEGTGAAKINKTSVNINLSYAPAVQSFLKAFVAHELFHSIQHQYYSLSSFLTGKWWMESTAEMAAGMAWNQDPWGAETIANRKFWFQGQLDFASTTYITAAPFDEHENTTGYFFDWLFYQKGVSFVDLWKKTSDNWFGTFLGNLTAYLKSKNIELESAYQEYSEFFVFSDSSPVRQEMTGNGMIETSWNEDHKVLFKKGDPARTWEFKLDYYSGKLIRVPTSGSTLHLNLKLTSNTTNMLVQVYALDANDNRRKLGTLTGASNELSFTINPGEVLYALAIAGSNSTSFLSSNTLELSEGGSATLAVNASNSVSITPPATAGDKSIFNYTIAGSLEGTDLELVSAQYDANGCYIMQIRCDSTKPLRFKGTTTISTPPPWLAVGGVYLQWLSTGFGYIEHGTDEYGYHTSTLVKITSPFDVEVHTYWGTSLMIMGTYGPAGGPGAEFPNESYDTENIFVLTIL